MRRRQQTAGRRLSSGSPCTTHSCVPNASPAVDNRCIVSGSTRFVFSGITAAPPLHCSATSLDPVVIVESHGDTPHPPLSGHFPVVGSRPTQVRRSCPTCTAASALTSGIAAPITVFGIGGQASAGRVSDTAASGTNTSSTTTVCEPLAPRPSVSQQDRARDLCGEHRRGTSSIRPVAQPARQAPAPVRAGRAHGQDEQPIPAES